MDPNAVNHDRAAVGVITGVRRGKRPPSTSHVVELYSEFIKPPILQIDIEEIPRVGRIDRLVETVSGGRTAARWIGARAAVPASPKIHSQPSIRMIERVISMTIAGLRLRSLGNDPWGPSVGTR
jgi:hypothetical protein